MYKFYFHNIPIPKVNGFQISTKRSECIDKAQKKATQKKGESRFLLHRGVTSGEVFKYKLKIVGKKKVENNTLTTLHLGSFLHTIIFCGSFSKMKKNLLIFFFRTSCRMDAEKFWFLSKEGTKIPRRM